LLVIKEREVDVSFGIGCSGTKASSVYQRRTLVAMGFYTLTVFGAALAVKHGHPTGWLLYVLAVLPAAPLIGMLVVLGRYLQEENDEYVRLMTMRSLLVATGALMSMIVISDFLRAFAATGVFPPFVLFVLFFVSFGIAQAVQRLQNRGGVDE
jgi:hypothetical protein